MNQEILRKIGLTEGEIRVYEAVVKLGKSSTGKIMENCGISSSKVYLILEKLIQKGFVTFTIENNVKKFQAANPINIIEYIQEKEKGLEETKKEAHTLVKELTQLIGSHEEETAKVYRGTKSMLTAYHNILDELGKEPFLFIGAPLEDLESLQLFFQNLHAKREHRNIKTKGLVHISTMKKYFAIFTGRKNIALKFVKLPFPNAIAIGKKRIIISLWEPTPIGFEIESQRIAQRYREFFKKIWNEGSTY